MNTWWIGISARLTSDRGARDTARCGVSAIGGRQWMGPKCAHSTPTSIQNAWGSSVGRGGLGAQCNSDERSKPGWSAISGVRDRTWPAGPYKGC